MYELIVLGLIPGTQMQITFTTWAIIATGLFGLITLRSIYRSQTLRHTIITLAIRREVRSVVAVEGVART